MVNDRVQVVLIGAGIMSTTLGVMLKKLMPDARISIYENLDEIAAESSDALNNSGTGHSAFCELNYTPVRDGCVDISKALDIAQSFELSKQFWAYLVESGTIDSDKSFIHTVPHISLVWNKTNRDMLHQRYEAMRQAPIFKDMQFTDDHAALEQWMPLIMHGRENNAILAATRMNAGTDVDFGALTRAMMSHLQHSEGVEVHLGHHVSGFTRLNDGGWRIRVRDLQHQTENEIAADFVFIGAGGHALPLLRKTGIKEARGYAGFPISGQFLKCTNPEVAQQHNAKVYGKAAVGTPPMSVPHLDTRVIDGQPVLLFGPYAGFTTRFLKTGSYLDLPKSLSVDNIWPLMSAGVQNWKLTQYLIKQVLMTQEKRFKVLQLYYPNARREDWNLIIAGQRVQIIEKVGGSGVLKFGTEIVSAADGSVAALLGASPGASTSVSIMLEVLERMFPEKYNSSEWQKIIRQMIPTYGESLIEDGPLCLQTRARTHDILDLSG